MEMKISLIPSRSTGSIPTGSSENVNHSRPIPQISKPFQPVPFHQYCWAMANRPFLK